MSRRCDGFGLSGDKEKDPLMQGGSLKVSAPMFPECVAIQCVDQLLRLCRGERVRRPQVMPLWQSHPAIYTNTIAKVAVSGVRT